MSNSNGIIKTQGVITEALPSASFKVRLQDGREVMGFLGGKMRLHHIRIMPGDKVEVEMSPYDQTKCRITFRMRN